MQGFRELPFQLFGGTGTRPVGMPPLPVLTESIDHTSVALEVVENKGLNKLVVFFSVAPFRKSFVFNVLGSRLYRVRIQLGIVKALT